MLEKIDCRNIIYNHFSTLKRYSDKRYNPNDFVLFLFVPLIITILMFLVRPVISDSISQLIITCGTVFAALLLNLLLIIYDIVKRTERADANGQTNDAGDLVKRRKKKKGVRLQFLQEIYHNISFSILLCVVIMMLTVFICFKFEMPYLNMGLSAIVYFLASIFGLTLLMVLKRVHLLLSHDISDKSP